MKRTLLILVISLIASTAYGQIRKDDNGTILGNGEIGTFTKGSLRTAREIERNKNNQQRPPTKAEFEEMKRISDQVRAKEAARQERLAAIQAKFDTRKADIELAKTRTWTSGTHTITAKFVKRIGNTITLERADTTQLEIVLDKLSQGDQDFILTRAWEDTVPAIVLTKEERALLAEDAALKKAQEKKDKEREKANRAKKSKK